MSRTERNYAKARLTLERKEAELRRAFNAWNKARAQVKRYEARLDKGINERASELAGKLDWTAPEFNEKREPRTHTAADRAAIKDRAAKAR